MTEDIRSGSAGRLGPLERLFLSDLASRGTQVIRVENAVPYWSSLAAARKAVSRLHKKGWLRRLERNLYLIVPLEAGLAGAWSEDPMVIAGKIAPDGAVAYWSALHYWGMTEQIPRMVFVQSPKRRANPRVTILGVHYRVITVIERKLFGIEVQRSMGTAFRITDREKTVVDALDRPDLCGGIRHVGEAVLPAMQVDWKKLDGYLDRFASGAVFKRLGYLVEILDLDVPDRNERIAAWQSRLSAGIALLEPGAGAQGAVSRRWQIRSNVGGEWGSR